MTLNEFKAEIVKLRDLAKYASTDARTYKLKNGRTWTSNVQARRYGQGGRDYLERVLALLKKVG